MKIDNTKKILFFVGATVFCISLLSLPFIIGKTTPDTRPGYKVTIVGSGIIGALEAYNAFLEAEKTGTKIRVTIYDKGPSNVSPYNTSFNIVPSLTADEILSVVPRGSEMVQKLAIRFSEPGGIYIDDVPGVNDSESAIRFKNEVAAYGTDSLHDDRTETLLNLGKLSMQLWQELYDKGDDELKDILRSSNFNPCREPKDGSLRKLHDGYRVDLLFGIANAQERAQGMQATYEKLGYKNCKILSPDEVMAIDPSLSNFCIAHSKPGNQIDLRPKVAFDPNKRIWDNDSVALWRPGGCLDSRIFLPKFFSYMKRKMGTYIGKSGTVKNCFRQKFEREVTGVEFSNANEATILALQFSNGKVKPNTYERNAEYIFCPGEAIGTLYKLGFAEPAYAGFAGPAFRLSAPLSPAQLRQNKNFNHCMEVHKEGIVLAWQAKIKQNRVCVEVGGTKAFYGDLLPRNNEAFATNRHVVQLNMINDVLPQFVSLALGYNTRGKKLTFDDITMLEKKGIVERWVGRRAVAYDGFPTLGHLYTTRGRKVYKARTTTHLGSGGVSFALGSVHVSRRVDAAKKDALVTKVLKYSDSRRTALRKAQR